MTTALAGTWFVLPTPFDDAGRIRLDDIGRLVTAAVSWGVDGLTVLGVMGEVAALSDDERHTAVRAVLDAASARLPVAVGCSSPSPIRTNELIADAHSLGAAAAMVAAPPLARNLDAVPRFFEQLTTDLPIIVQDEPAATGTTLPVSILSQCVTSCRCAAVKLEDPPTPPKVAAVRALHPNVPVFGGLGGGYALAELRRGASGTMTGFSFPEALRSVRIACEANRMEDARARFERFLPLIHLEAQHGVGLAIRKEVLRRRGAMTTAEVRLGPSLDDVHGAEIDEALAACGISDPHAVVQVS